MSLRRACPAVSTATSNGATSVAAAATLIAAVAAAVLLDSASLQHRLRRGRRVRDQHDVQRRLGARQVQPNARRGYGWGLFRVRQDGGATGEPGWHVHLRDEGNGSGEREPSRGQLRVRRVHGRLRGPLPAAIGAAVAAPITASFAAAVTAAAVTTTAVSTASAAARPTDMRVQHNACRWWR